jgi:hypothetical protein
MNTPVFLIGDQIKIKINCALYRAVVCRRSDFFNEFFCKIIQNDGSLNGFEYPCSAFPTELIPRAINPKASIQQKAPTQFTNHIVHPFIY